MPNYELPEYLNKRVRYFDGQFLTDRDFVDEQNYHLDRRQRQNRLLRSPGILDGLEVAETSDSTGIKITPGTAVDYQGRLIILHDIVDFEGEPLERQGEAFVLSTENYADKQVTLYLSYSQQEADQATPDAQSGDAARGSAGYTRWLEQPVLELVEDGSVATDETAIAIGGEITIDADGRISQLRRISEANTYSAVRFGEDAVTLRRNGRNRLEVSGNLNVTSSLSVQRDFFAGRELKISRSEGVISSSKGLTFVSSIENVHAGISETSFLRNVDSQDEGSNDFHAYGIGAREDNSLVYDTHKYHRWRVGNEEKMLLDSLGSLKLSGAISSPNLGFIDIAKDENFYESSSSEEWSTAVAKEINLKFPTNLVIFGHAHCLAKGNAIIHAPIFINGVMFEQLNENQWGWGTGVSHIGGDSVVGDPWHPIIALAHHKAEANTDYKIEFRLSSYQGRNTVMLGGAMLLILKLGA